MHNNIITAEQKKVLFLASMGGLFEYYDFYIYILFSGYFAQQFFPHSNHLIELTETYVIFFIAYLFRPIGAIVFSHIGDEYGRKIVMVITMFIMGCGSLGIGLLPTYNSIGILAPILLLTLRMLQGVAYGGEIPNIIVYGSESVPHNSGFAMGKIFAFTVSGLLLGLLINLIITHTMTHSQIIEFGWRIPFLLGSILSLFAYILRKNLAETKIFQALQRKEKFPLKTLLLNYKAQTILCGSLTMLLAGPTTLIVFFMPTYLNNIVHLNSAFTSQALLIATFTLAVGIYVGGIICDYIVPQIVLSVSLVALIITSCIGYYLISIHSNLLIALILMSVNQGVVLVSAIVMLPRLYPTNVRLSGVSIPYNISSLIFIGVLPIIVTMLIAYTKAIFMVPIFIIVTISILGIILVNFAKRYDHELT
jgi:predicted MFS family arabinose efflux permease